MQVRKAAALRSAVIGAGEECWPDAKEQVTAAAATVAVAAVVAVAAAAVAVAVSCCCC